MLTNLLSVIRGVSNKGTCIVELGQRANACQQWGNFNICGTTISAELNHCHSCSEMVADELESMNWDDSDFVLEPLSDAGLTLAEDSLNLGEIELHADPLCLGDGIDLDAAWSDAQLAWGYRAV